MKLYEAKHPKKEIKIRREEDLATLLWFLNTLFIVSYTSTTIPQTHTHDLPKRIFFFVKWRETHTNETHQGTTVCWDYSTIERFQSSHFFHMCVMKIIKFIWIKMIITMSFIIPRNVNCANDASKINTLKRIMKK